MMLDGTGVGLLARKQILATPGAPKDPVILQHPGFWNDFIKQFMLKNFMILCSAMNQADAFYSFREVCLGMYTRSAN